MCLADFLHNQWYQAIDGFLHHPAVAIFNQSQQPVFASPFHDSIPAYNTHLLVVSDDILASCKLQSLQEL